MTSARLRVAHVVPDLRPESGGPAENVPRLCAALRQAGVEADLHTVGPLPGWLPVGLAVHGHLPAPPERLRRSPALARALQGTPADLIHAHCLWQLPLGYAARAAARRGLPLVVSPRGMLAPWSLRRSPLLKLLARALVHRGALRQAAAWHATSDQEARDIVAAGYDAPVCVAPNGVEPVEPDLAATRAAYHALAPELAGRRVLLFYSRFHPKKRPLELVRDFAALAGSRPRWHLLAVGIPESFGPEQVRAEARAAGIGERVTALDGRALPKPYPLGELFVLPTHDENFGRVVAEALAHGLPVLTTRGTPWRELETWRAGASVPLEGLRSALDELLGLSAETLRQMGARGREGVLRGYAWEVVVRPLVELYERLARRSGA